MRSSSAVRENTIEGIAAATDSGPEYSTIPEQPFSLALQGRRRIRISYILVRRLGKAGRPFDELWLRAESRQPHTNRARIFRSVFLMIRYLHVENFKKA
jgi:hypothetical protein